MGLSAPGWRVGLAFALLAALAVGLSPPAAQAAATQEEFLKSISNQGDGGGSSVDVGRVMAVVAGVAGLVLLVVFLSQRQKRQVRPKVFNHQGKLLKEVLRQVSIRSGDMKRLKTLADEKGCCSPLTLLLCPSLAGRQEDKETGRQADKETR